MSTNNSTALKQDSSLPVSYSKFICDLTYQFYRVKAAIAGARSMVYVAEDKFIERPELLDAVMLLDDVIDRIVVLNSAASNTELDYQVKAEDEPKKINDTTAFKSELYGLIDEKFSILLYALAGLREEAKSTAISSNDIGKFESLVSDSRHEITTMLNQ